MMPTERAPDDDRAEARHLAAAIIARYRRRTGTEDGPPLPPETVGRFITELERFLAGMRRSMRDGEGAQGALPPRNGQDADPPRRPLRVLMQDVEVIVSPDDPTYDHEYQVALQFYRTAGLPMPYAGETSGAGGE